jgi:hypothetical protein
MNWSEALELVVAKTKHSRYRALVASDHPDHEYWRRRIVELATGVIDYPPLATQVTNALKAGLAFVASGFKLTDQAEHDRRLSICRAPCEFWDREQGRCRACGCVDEWKAWVETQKCPKGFWEAKS